MATPALFLDRDGVINVNHGYVYRPEETDFVDGIFQLVAWAKKACYKVIVVTNQAGIARGYYTEDQFREYSSWLEQQFIERGGRLDATYFCPHHPEHGRGEYLVQCNCRKPAPGMLLSAARDHDLDLARSVLLGDQPSDIRAGFAAGVGRCFLFSDFATGAIDGIDERKFIRVNALLSVAEHLSGRYLSRDSLRQT